MGLFDYFHGAADAQFFNDIADSSVAANATRLLNEQNEQIANLKRQLAQAKNNLANANEAIAELNNDLANETKKSKRSYCSYVAMNAAVNTMISEYELTKEYSDIVPALLPSNEEGEKERERLVDRFYDEARKNGDKLEQCGLTIEQVREYHLKRMSGEKEPDFD